MLSEKEAQLFFSNYDERVCKLAFHLRKMLLTNLPGITEQIDLPAKMMAYCYGQKYRDMICAVFPSKKGLKISFNRVVEIPDPDKMLEGKGKIIRYVVIHTKEQIQSSQLKKILSVALNVYREMLKEKI